MPAGWGARPGAGFTPTMLEFNEYIKILTALTAIVNPIGAIPVFLNITREHTAAERKKSLKTTMVTVVIVLLVVMFLGKPILTFFGISVASFRVGGGILILFMALGMLQGRDSRVKQNREESQVLEEKQIAGVVPLAIPILAGPGAISSTILYSEQAQGFNHFLFLSIIILAVSAIVFTILSLAPRISVLLGKIGINIVTRIMGLIMMAISVEFITKGLATLLPGLATFH